MRIGIDGRLWSESGVGRYIRNLVLNLAKIDKENEYFLFLLKKNLDQKLTKNFNLVGANYSWYGISEQLKFPRLLNKYSLDLMHFPHFNVPIFYSGKFVVTIHDLIHQHFQMRRATTLDPISYKMKQLGYKRVFKSAINRSQKIITPSNFVKNQLIKEWGIKDNRITVTHEAVEEHLIAIATRCTKDEIKKTLDKFRIRIPFIFYIGNAHPHKNVEGLIEAFVSLREKYQYLQLVLSGNDHYFWQRIKTDYKNKDIIYTGLITDQELVSLYKSARVFVMPSFEEGFGIPILEAMACGCPVVASSAASLPEVGGEACLYFDPRSTENMVEKISEVLNDQKLRIDLIDKGEKRYMEFSWEKLAKETLGIYQS